MTEHILLINAALLLVYMTLWFVVARLRRRLDTVDMAWGGGFVAVAWSVAVQHADVRTVVVAVLVSLWGSRLFSHILRRARKSGEDPRYAEMAKKWRGNVWARAYVMIFLLQGMLIWIISLPVVYAAGNSSDGSWLLWLGTAVWLFGFVFESAADRQLATFISNPKHKGQVMQTGLWHYSRHPNYFGELLQWWAIGVIALSASFGWIGLVGPLALTTLIVFISGIPPIENRKKSDPKYREYMQHTSPLVPLPRRSRL
jgi:steroid 5-alpha reductase family enzyme